MSPFAGFVKERGPRVPGRVSRRAFIAGPSADRLAGRDGHFAGTVAVVLEHVEGWTDLLHRHGVGEEGRETRGVVLQEPNCEIGFVVGPAHIEQGQFFATRLVKFELDHSLGRDAGVDHACTISGCEERLAHGAFLGGAVDDEIDAALAGLLPDLGDDISLPGIEDYIGAELCGDGAAFRYRFDDPDSLNAGELQYGEGHESDGARTEDKGGFTRVRLCELHAVENNGKRFGKGTLGEAELGRKREKVRRGQIHDLAEKARFARRAEESEVGADVVLAGHAELAVVAVKRRFEDCTIAGVPTGDTGSGTKDDT